MCRHWPWHYSSLWTHHAEQHASRSGLLFENEMNSENLRSAHCLVESKLLAQDYRLIINHSVASLTAVGSFI
jgi:hypothetical protein